MNMLMYALLGVVINAGGISMYDNTDMWMSVIAIVMLIDLKPWEDWGSDDSDSADA